MTKKELKDLIFECIENRSNNIKESAMSDQDIKRKPNYEPTPEERREAARRQAAEQEEREARARAAREAELERKYDKRPRNDSGEVIDDPDYYESANITEDTEFNINN